MGFTATFVATFPIFIFSELLNLRGLLSVGFAINNEGVSVFKLNKTAITMCFVLFCFVLFCFVLFCFVYIFHIFTPVFLVLKFFLPSPPPSFPYTIPHNSPLLRGKL